MGAQTLVIGCLVALQAAPPPCDDPNVRPASCGAPPRWICLAPDFAAADIADREAALAACDARRRAELAELRVSMSRDLAKRGAELMAERTQHGITLDELDRVNRALRQAENEVSSRWTTWELVGFVAGGLLVGAAVGGVVGWHLTK